MTSAHDELLNNSGYAEVTRRLTPGRTPLGRTLRNSPDRPSAGQTACPVRPRLAFRTPSDGCRPKFERLVVRPGGHTGR
eukprot:2370652-Alexandrium_andersonii.AAC.1